MSYKRRNSNKDTIITIDEEQQSPIGLEGNEDYHKAQTALNEKSF